MRISDWSSDVCSSDLLTTAGRTRTHWTLPEWFYPDGRTPLSYHGDQDRWARSVHGCTLRSVAKGQEFVLSASEYRSEERRVGKECVGTCRSRWSPDH